MSTALAEIPSEVTARQMIVSVKNNNSLVSRVCMLLLLCGILGGCERDSSSFYLLDGAHHRLADYRGKWLLVNFWAEWCGPCLEEVPELNQIHQQATDNNWALLAFSYDKVSNEQLRAAKRRFEIAYPMVATSPEPQVPFKRPSKLPALIIISPSGEIHGPYYGRQDMKKVQTIIKQLKS